MYSSASVVGECSKLPMKSTKTPGLPETLTAVISPLPSSDQASELLPSYLTRVLGVPKTGKGLASRSGYVVDVFDTVKAGSSMSSVSDAEESIGFGVSSATASFETPMLKDVPPILGRYPWVAQNRFYPLSDLGNGIEDEFEEGEVLVEEQRGISVDSGGGVQTESGLHILPWENREVVDHSCDGGEEDFCVLECDPLSRCEPNELRELVLVQDSVEGTQVMESVTPSNWVSQTMKNLCNMVGFPIVKHEAQCYALFRLLEQECLKVVDGGVSKRPINSGSLGIRELKGLISNINYDGVSSRNRSRVSSTSVGGCWQL
nr:hypothetical protein CFP56_71158 [Quercus suber]